MATSWLVEDLIFQIVKGWSSSKIAILKFRDNFLRMVKSSPSKKPRLHRVMATFSSFDEREKVESDEWRAMMPTQRLKAVEIMRCLNHPGYDPSTARLQRFYSVA